jgi:hypothetical protein
MSAKTSQDQTSLIIHGLSSCCNFRTAGGATRTFAHGQTPTLAQSFPRETLETARNAVRDYFAPLRLLARFFLGRG